MRARTLWKLVVAILIAGGLAWLFLKTLRDTIADPYVIGAGALSGWSLVLDESDSGIALLALHPPEQVRSELFRQLFQRTMISLSSPAIAAMPVVLQSEYAESLQTVLGQDEILRMAREAGLEREPLEPVCVAVRQDASGGRTRQLFFAVFEAPAFERFRERLAVLHRERGAAGAFDAGALRPMLPIAASEREHTRWPLPAIDPEVDCRAPLMAASPAT
jgi:hypothetical protein